MKMNGFSLEGLREIIVVPFLRVVICIVVIARLFVVVECRIVEFVNVKDKIQTCNIKPPQSTKLNGKPFTVEVHGVRGNLRVNGVRRVRGYIAVHGLGHWF